jgi:tetratricopeptide (TPR) repeat protein
MAARPGILVRLRRRGRMPGGSIVPRTPRIAVVVLSVAVAAAIPVVAQDAPPPAPTPAPATGTEPAAAAAPAAPAALTDAGAAALQEAKDAFKKGAWADAIPAALKVIAEQPKNLEALYIAGTAERQTADLAAAEGHLKTLVEASPIFPLGHFQLAYVEFLQAEALAREGKYDSAKSRYADAAEEFGKELARNPTHLPSLSSRAIALTRGGNFDEAIPAYEAWIAAAPQKNDPVVALASAYAASGKSSDAMATLDRLPDKTPKAVFDGVLAAANVFVAKKDWGAAVPFLEKAVDTDPTSTKALALLTEACARAGLVPDAVAHLEKLLTMEPTPDEGEAVGEAIKAAVGNGKVAPSIPGLEPPAVLRVPTPRYPKGQDQTVQTEVLVLTLVTKNSTIGGTVMVPNRIWKDIRTTGFEAEAFDAVRRGKFLPGTRDGQAADIWIVVAVKFAHI